MLKSSDVSAEWGLEEETQMDQMLTAMLLAMKGTHTLH